MDPNYAHDFLPSRKGRCKRIIGAEHCGLGENAEVHRRAAARRQAAQDANEQQEQPHDLLVRAATVSRLERLLPTYKCVFIAVFNVRASDVRKARARVIAEFGRDVYDREVKAKIKTGIMEMFQHKPTRPLKRFAWYCAFAAEKRATKQAFENFDTARSALRKACKQGKHCLESTGDTNK